MEFSESTQICSPCQSLQYITTKVTQCILAELHVHSVLHVKQPVIAFENLHFYLSFSSELLKFVNQQITVMNIKDLANY